LLSNGIPSSSSLSSYTAFIGPCIGVLEPTARAQRPRLPPIISEPQLLSQRHRHPSLSRINKIFHSLSQLHTLLIDNVDQRIPCSYSLGVPLHLVRRCCVFFTYFGRSSWIRDPSSNAVTLPKTMSLRSSWRCCRRARLRRGGLEKLCIGKLELDGGAEAMITRICAIVSQVRVNHIKRVIFKAARRRFKGTSQQLIL